MSCEVPPKKCNSVMSNTGRAQGLEALTRAGCRGSENIGRELLGFLVHI